jgi:hypothetical protein
MAFRDENHGVAVGGDYKQPGQAGSNVALTSDGGRTWRLPTGPEPAGFRSAVTLVPGTQSPTWIAVGPSGSDCSLDGGESWAALGTTGFQTVGFAGSLDVGWAVGDEGRIARFAGRLPVAR